MFSNFTEIILVFVYISLFLFLIARLNFFKVNYLSRRNISIAFLLKISTGFLLTYIYTYVYQDRSVADIYRFFDDGRVIASSLSDNPIYYLQLVFGFDAEAEHLKPYLDQTLHWYRDFRNETYNDSRTIIRFNALVHLFSFGNFNVHTVFMCFLSTLGLTAIFKVFVVQLKSKRLELYIAVFLFPSVLFWSSGALKEGLIMFALGNLLYNFNKLITDKITFVRLIITLVFFCLLCISKMYIAFIMVPALAAMALMKNATSWRSLYKLGVVLLTFLLIAANIDLVFFEFDVFNILYRKQQDFIGLANSVNATSFFNPIVLEPNFLSFLISSPIALTNVFIKPHLLEANSVLHYMAAFENMVILCLVALAIGNLKKGEKAWSLIALCFIIFLLIYLLVGFTTPVYGAIVRYKMPSLPFLIILLLLLTNDKFRLPRILRDIYD